MSAAKPLSVTTKSDSFGGDQVGDDAALADGDICEGAGMNEDGLAFDGLDEVGIERIDHPGGHGAIDFKVGGGDGFSVFVVGDDDFGHATAEVGQAGRDGQNGHDFAGDGNLCAGFHLEAVELAAFADGDVAQGLSAEIDSPFDLDVFGVDVEAFETDLGQACVVVVVFVLHPGGQRDHGQIVGTGDTFDVAGQADGEGNHRYALGEAAAGGGAFDVEGRAAAGLTDAADDALAEFAEALHQADGGGGFALAERGGGDGRNINVAAGRGEAETFQYFGIVDLGHVFRPSAKVHRMQAPDRGRAGRGV